MMQEKREIRVTGDGSHTIYLSDLDEHYHSHHGAIQEAKHVFLNNGLDLFSSCSELNILEIGLGTGLNAFLTALFNEGKTQGINYMGLEAYPVSQEEARQLNFVTDPQYDVFFQAIHSSPWEEQTQLLPNFRLHKIQRLLVDLNLDTGSIDLIYFDAFGPRVQPEMWTPTIFEMMYNFLKTGGCLVTYCAKGQVKRDLKSVGFRLETLPGPPGKREMIRVWKD